MSRPTSQAAISQSFLVIETEKEHSICAIRPARSSGPQAGRMV